MPPAKKESRFKDIKDTANDAVEIIRELRTPEVQETLDKVKLMMDQAKQIMEEMKTPEWVQNINNFRLISENISNTSARAERMVQDVKSMPLINSASSLMGSSRAGEGDGRGNGGIQTDLRETIVVVREMLQSFRALADELRITFARQETSEIIRDVGQTARDVSSTVQTIKNQV